MNKHEIGVATTGLWAAVWTVGSPYINIISRDFFDEHRDGILEAAVEDRVFSDTKGQTGTVHALCTNGDLGEDDHPKGYDSPADYVAAELEAWAREDGGDYSRAVAEGYTR